MSNAQGDADHQLELVIIRMKSYRGEANPWFHLSSLGFDDRILLLGAILKEPCVSLHLCIL